MRIPRALFLVLPLLAFLGVASPVLADEVEDWNQIMFKAAVTAGTSPLFMSRNAAIVQAAVYDALNGIEGHFEAIHPISQSAPPGASRRAAVVQAAYAALMRLYASQSTMLNAARQASLDAIASGEAAEKSQSIQRGIEWGQAVADNIWNWRKTDGFSSDGVTAPPLTFDGGPAPYPNGRWRPTPPGNLNGVGYPSFSNQETWVMNDHASFRNTVPPPPLLSSQDYLDDYLETKAMADYTRANPTSDQTQLSLFWNAGTASAYWHRAALQFADQRHFTLSERSRLLAFVSLAMADASIACWDAKYVYVFWRPITAIRIADDGVAATPQDPNWNTLFNTPNHPEYPSGHSCVSGAAAEVLTQYFGDAPLSLESNTVPGQVRSWPSLTAALNEVKDARVFPGIHFRTATENGQTLGKLIADYVLEHALGSAKGKRNGQQP